VVLADGAVGQRHKPNHVRMRGGKVLRLDVGEGTEDGVLAGGGVDVDAVAGDPSEQLRFRLHKGKEGCAAAGREQESKAGCCHYAWGGRLCLHPFNVGFRIALSRDSEIPHLKRSPPVALRQRIDHSNSRLAAGAKPPAPVAN